MKKIRYLILVPILAALLAACSGTPPTDSQAQALPTASPVAAAEVVDVDCMTVDFNTLDEEQRTLCVTELRERPAQQPAPTAAPAGTQTLPPPTCPTTAPDTTPAQTTMCPLEAARQAAVAPQTGNCDASESYVLTGLTQVVIEGNAHVEYFDAGVHRETILGKGTWNIAIPQRWGFVWEYASCTYEQVLSGHILPHIGSNNWQYVATPPASIFTRMQ